MYIVYFMNIPQSSIAIDVTIYLILSSSSLLKQRPKRGGETRRGIGAGTTFGGAGRGGDEK